jgi:MinD superfamily P-loop ATPase
MKEIVVISGKGGTGKTSVVCGLAGVGPEKVLADCDVDAADLHLIMHPEVRESHRFISGEMASIDRNRCTECGLCLEYCRFQAVSSDYRILEEHCEGCALCSHVCPEGAISMRPRYCGDWFISRSRFGPMVHASLGIGEENSGKLVTTVRKEAHRVAEDMGYDLVLVDGSPGIGCPVIASLTNADLALLVAEPSVSALGDLERVSELTGFFGIPSRCVINKADINPELTERIEAFCRKHSIQVVGKLAYNERFTQAQIHGQTIGEYDADGLGREIQAIWSAIESGL